MRISRGKKFSDRRFRCARTQEPSYVNPWSFDHVCDGGFSETMIPFQEGDRVEFKDPKTGKMVQSKVTTKTRQEVYVFGGKPRMCVMDEAYVYMGRKLVRVVDAPALRFIE